MDNSTKWRWAGLLSMLTITVAAIFYPLDPNNETTTATGETQRAKLSAASVSVPIMTTGLSNEAADAMADPFAPRGWQAPPTPIPVVPKVAIAMVEPALPLKPIGPPPLPFQFTGRLNDGGEQVVYLTRGDQMFVVRNGETLESIYKVLVVDAQRMEFLHLPTGEKQTLLLPSAEN